MIELVSPRTSATAKTADHSRGEGSQKGGGGLWYLRIWPTSKLASLSLASLSSRQSVMVLIRRRSSVSFSSVIAWCRKIEFTGGHIIELKISYQALRVFLHEWTVFLPEQRPSC